MADVDKKQEPRMPIKRPKQTQEIKLRKGKMRIQKYIKNKSLAFTVKGTGKKEIIRVFTVWIGTDCRQTWTTIK